MPNIMKAVNFMINTALDDTHGYDQLHRNSPDYDCSSLVATALHEAGFNISPFSWTGNLEEQLRNAGFVDCTQPWLAGDIHLNRLYHVNMSISNAQIVEASINEKGDVIGGVTGDQTGKEIAINNYYEYNEGWDVHLRYIGNNTNIDSKLSIDTIAREVMKGKWGNGTERIERLTNAGYDYNIVQEKVNNLVNGTELKDSYEVAREVLYGKWGNGSERVERLTNAGYDYNSIQDIVNQMLG